MADTGVKTPTLTCQTSLYDPTFLPRKCLRTTSIAVFRAWGAAFFDQCGDRRIVQKYLKIHFFRFLEGSLFCHYSKFDLVDNYF